MLPLLFFILSLTLPIHSTLTVITPKETYTLPYNVANFGEIPYGKQISGEVIAANPMTNCEVEDNIADDNLNAKSNRFLLMLRGDCKFVTKVRNAQSELAKVAIIMDNTKASEGFNGIVMSADGNSRDIKIPSVFISESDGNKILASVLENSNSNFSVKISINFPTSKTDVPEMFLFSDPNNRGSYIFVREFYKYIKDNIHGVSISLYHNFYNCSNSVCNERDCYPGTTVCALPPVGDRVGRGLDVIKQSLREQFVVQTSYSKGLEYMTLIDEHCIDYSNIQQCSKKQLDKVGIRKEYIQQQLNNQNRVKLRLLTSLTMKEANHIIFFPDVLINNITYYGQLSGMDVFEMLCNSFTSAPKACNPYVQNYVNPQTKSLDGWTILGIIVISLTVFFVVLVCVCRRCLRRRISKEVNNEINQLVSHYITDYETKRIEGFKESKSQTEASR